MTPSLTMPEADDFDIEAQNRHAILAGIREAGYKVAGYKPDGTIVVDLADPLPASQHPGYVYFIVGGPFVKIGWSLLLRGRLPSLQTGNPYKLELVAAQYGSIDTEREIHQRFAVHRGQGEWFTLHQDILDHIAQLKTTGEDKSAHG